MLDILDYTQQRLNTNVNFWKFADTHITQPTTFRGVSFVSSINLLKKPCYLVILKSF